MIALIDGDMVIYMAAFAHQNVVDMEDGLGDQTFANEDEAVRKAIRMVHDWTKKAGCSRPIVCLSSAKSDSFRHRLWPEYKAGRPPKPLAYTAVRQAIEVEFETYEEPGLEADDLMGIAGTSESAQCVIVSRDKDMKTVPALLLNPDHDTKPVKIRKAVADQNWLLQTMMGDNADKYPGIPGIGEVNGQQILLNPHRITQVTKQVKSRKTGKIRTDTKWVKGEPCDIWQSMVDYTIKAGLDENHLICMAQLARILRSGDFDKETRTVRLWVPGGYKELKLDEDA